MLAEIFNEPSGLVQWVVLPILIFLARAFDVTLATLRIVFIAQGRSGLASFTGFFEALVWILIIGQVIDNLANPLCVVAYAGGFAMGNTVGLRVEERLALGRRILRVILRTDAEEMILELRDNGFGVTTADGEGKDGPVKILFILVERRDVTKVIEIVQRHSPKAFFTVEGLRQTGEAFLRPRGAPEIPQLLRRLAWQKRR